MLTFGRQCIILRIMEMRYSAFSLKLTGNSISAFICPCLHSCAHRRHTRCPCRHTRRRRVSRKAASTPMPGLGRTPRPWAPGCAENDAAGVNGQFRYLVLIQRNSEKTNAINMAELLKSYDNSQWPAGATPVHRCRTTDLKMRSLTPIQTSARGAPERRSIGWLACAQFLSSRSRDSGGCGAEFDCGLAVFHLIL